MNEDNRTKKWREKGRKEGKKQVNVMLDPEGADALEDLQEALPGWSYARIISRALALAQETPARLDTRVEGKVKGSIERLEECMEEVLQRLQTMEYKVAALGRPGVEEEHPLLAGVDGPAREHPGDATMDSAWGMGADETIAAGPGELGGLDETLDDKLDEKRGEPQRTRNAPGFAIPDGTFEEVHDDLDNLEEDDLDLFASSDDLPGKG